MGETVHFKPCIRPRTVYTYSMVKIINLALGRGVGSFVLPPPSHPPPLPLPPPLSPHSESRQRRRPFLGARPSTAGKSRGGWQACSKREPPPPRYGYMVAPHCCRTCRYEGQSVSEPGIPIPIAMFTNMKRLVTGVCSTQ